MANIRKMTEHRWLRLILFLSFIASVGYAWFYRIPPAVDAAAYDHIALNIIAGHGFVEDTAKDVLFDHAITRAGPAYEYFLAFVYTVFGHSYAAVWVIQALLHAATAWLLWLIARLAFPESGERVGLVAAALIGFHPDLIEISAMLMTETLYLFLVTLGIYLFVRVYQAPRKSFWSILLGAIIGIAILSRPPVILFVPVILFFYCFKKQYRQAALFGACLFLTLMPWLARNFTIYHRVIATTMIGEYNLWVGNTVRSTGGQISGGYNPATEYAERYGYAMFHQAATQAFTGFVVEHPGSFIKLVTLRVVRYFSLIRPMGFWFYQHGLPQAFFVSFSGVAIALLFTTGFAGMVLAWQKREDAYRYLIAFAMTAPIALLPAVVESRYRFQAYPFLAIFGAYFFVTWRRDPTPLKHVLLAVGSVLMIVALIDTAFFWRVVIERLTTFF